MGRSSKGSSFEREVCKTLSLWWTDGRRDDVFWRTAGSGARATTRRSKGKKTHGQSSDICATDPIGEPLTDLLTIECKRGYNTETIIDVIDKADHHAIQKFEAMLDQVITDFEDSGTFAWMLIHRRDQRKAVCWMPRYFYNLLTEAIICGPRIKMDLAVTRKLNRQTSYCQTIHIAGVLFEEFLDSVEKRDILTISNSC